MTETFFRLYNYEVLFSYNTYIIISIYLTTLITYPKNNAYPPCHPTQLPSYATYVQSDPSMFPSIINKSVKGRFFSSLFLSNYLPILISIYPSIYLSICRAFCPSNQTYLYLYCNHPLCLGVGEHADVLKVLLAELPQTFACKYQGHPEFIDIKEPFGKYRRIRLILRLVWSL